jgi:hypothetical protein
MLSDVFHTNCEAVFDTLILTTVRTVDLNWNYGSRRVTGQKGMFPPPRDLIPPLVYPEVRICSVLRFVLCAIYLKGGRAVALCLSVPNFIFTWKCKPVARVSIIDSIPYILHNLAYKYNVLNGQMLFDVVNTIVKPLLANCSTDSPDLAQSE